MASKKTSSAPKELSRKKTVAASQNRDKHWALYYANLILIAAVLIVYVPTFNLGFTELDDSIFIKETRDYNKDLSNLTTSFQRGVFNVTEDVYYRPLLLDSYILNYQFSKEKIRGYHVVNVLLHLISVLLLFVLLKKIRLEEWSAFLLTLLFAVHPMLSQAVTWIPGRNDTLLAIFVFTFLIGAINYVESKKFLWLILQCIALIAALFTKETAVFAAPVAWILVIYLQKRKWFDRNSILLYCSWFFAGAFWFVVRSQATLKNSDLQFADVIKTFPTRTPVLIQYLGKIFLPLNLNVFPITQDTSYVFGVIAVIILAAILFFSQKPNWRMVIAGLAIYVLLFIPALMVPASLNDQDFEHRAYLPMVGMLIVLSQSALLRNPLKKTTLLYIGFALVAVLSIMNIIHQKNFKSPLAFWTAAQKSSPHSAYATMMLGARLDSVDINHAEQLIRQAYSMDSNQKYINYYVGTMLQKHDSVLASERFFQKEKKISNYYMCDFHLARVAFEKHDRDAAIQYLETYLIHAPEDPQANNNLLLLYSEKGQHDKVRAQAEKMQLMGMKVPPQFLQGNK